MGKKLSLVLPAYNASVFLSNNLPKVINYLDGLNILYEIIIVDDGSKDHEASAKLAKEFQCIFVGLPKNLGKGAALRAGMLAAEGEYRIFTDADIPYEFETIEKFLWYLDHKEFHIVIGDRTLSGSNYFGEVPKVRKIASKIYSFIVGRFIVSGLLDTQCGIKGFRANVVEDIFGVSRINRFAVDVELLYIAYKRNYDIKRLPVNLRVWEASQIRALFDGVTMIRDIFVIWLNYRLGRYDSQQDANIAIDTFDNK